MIDQFLNLLGRVIDWLIGWIPSTPDTEQVGCLLDDDDYWPEEEE